MTTGRREVDDVLAGLEAHDYLADRALATAVLLALDLERPLLLEGEAGVGKTELALAVARWTGGELIRLQCYEGIDVSQALYEWDHPRQLLHLRAAEAAGRFADGDPSVVEHELYTEPFLVRRPVLRALAGTPGGARPVLLVDEIDRADDEFEALLLEALADHAVTVPELGTIRSAVVPVVIVTSNRTRELHDALKRRCLYHWVEHPSLDREIEIIRRRAPDAVEALTDHVARVVAELRTLGLYKVPGVAESIDWARALVRLGVDELDAGTLDATLGVVVKSHEDQQRVRAHGTERVLEVANGG